MVNFEARRRDRKAKKVGKSPEIICNVRRFPKTYRFHPVLPLRNFEESRGGGSLDPELVSNLSIFVERADFFPLGKSFGNLSS